MAMWDATDAVLTELEVDRELHEIIRSKRGHTECPTCDRVMGLLRTTTDLHESLGDELLQTETQRSKKVPFRKTPGWRERFAATILAVTITLGLGGTALVARGAMTDRDHPAVVVHGRRKTVSYPVHPSYGVHADSAPRAMALANT